MGTTWRPAPGQVTLIELDGREDALTGVVMSGENGAVVIDLGASPGPPTAPFEVVASFFQPDALYRVRATAEPRDDQRAVIDLRVHEVERVQRRGVPRVKASYPAAMSAFDGPGEFASVTGETVDLGPGGCRIRTTKSFPTGCDPTITLQLPGGDLVALAQILQVNADRGHFEYRLAFMSLEDGDAKRLAELAETA
jgi:hypothetical protein